MMVFMSSTPSFRWYVLVCAGVWWHASFSVTAFIAVSHKFAYFVLMLAVCFDFIVQKFKVIFTHLQVVGRDSEL